MDGIEQIGPRVLNPSEVKLSWENWPHDIPAAPTFDQWLCQAQDTKSYAAGLADGREQALKEVGEWLAKKAEFELDHKGLYVFYIHSDDILDLKRGEMPK